MWWDPHRDPGLRAGDSQEVFAKFQARQASLSKGSGRGNERAGPGPGLSCWVMGGSLGDGRHVGGRTLGAEPWGLHLVGGVFAKGRRHSNRYIQAVWGSSQTSWEDLWVAVQLAQCWHEPQGWGGGTEHWPTPPFRGHLGATAGGGGPTWAWEGASERQPDSRKPRRRERSPLQR